MNDDERREISQEEFIKLVNLSYNIAFEESFRKVKLKKKELDDYLQEIIDGTGYSPRDFIINGLDRTLSPVLLSLIKEKLRRYAERNKKNQKGDSALVVLTMLHNDIHPGDIPFFMAVFALNASRRPLAENDKVWKYLYLFLPEKVQKVDTSELIEAPEYLEKDKEKYERLDSGILIPKKKGKGKDSSGIILTDKD